MEFSSPGSSIFISSDISSLPVFHAAETGRAKKMVKMGLIDLNFKIYRDGFMMVCRVPENASHSGIIWTSNDWA